MSIKTKIQLSISIIIEHISFPQFSPSRALDQLQVRVMDTNCRYDFIFGRDCLELCKFVLDFDNHTIIARDITVPMRPFETLYHMAYSTEPDDYLNSGYKSKTISATTYDDIPTSSNHITSLQHLSPSQRDDLIKALAPFTELFNGKLRGFTDYEIDLELRPDAKPHASRAYPVPCTQLPVFKHQLDDLVQNNALEPAERSEWIAGTFIIPKKDGKARWITDFRALNAALVRRVYPIPRVTDIISRRTGYKFVTCLDLTRHHYAFIVKKQCRHLLTIATPFGLYRYNRLPMGVCQSPDIAQEIMEKILRDIDDLEIYIDDIACFSNDFPTVLNQFGSITWLYAFFDHLIKT